MRCTIRESLAQGATVVIRFRKSIKLLPGVRINLSRSGISTSVGVRGARVTVGPRGRTTSVGLPGTGLSHTSTTRATPARPPQRAMAQAAVAGARRQAGDARSEQIVRVPLPRRATLILSGLAVLATIGLFLLAIAFVRPVRHNPWTSLFLIGSAVGAFVFWMRPRPTMTVLVKARVPAPVAAPTPYHADAKAAAQNDEWEGSFWEVQDPIDVRAQLRLRYTDGSGQRTERVVDVHRLGPYGPGRDLIIGYCHMRNATRTFRTDRIAQAVDIATGEIIADPSAWLRARYAASPVAATKRLLEEEFDAICVLYYVGKADGQLRRAEREIIVATCQALGDDAQLTPDTLDDMISTLDLPNANAFRGAVRRLAARDASLRAIVMHACEKIVATQKTVHPLEKDALDFMRARLGAGLS